MIKHLENLKQKFLEWGYPLDIVREKGAALDREDLLKPKCYPSQATPAVPIKPKFVPTFIITYNPHSPPLKKWLKETFLILQSDKKMKQIYEKPPSVTFRQARNLKQILVRNRLRELPYTDCTDLPPAGCHRHEHGNRGRACMLCPKLKESRTFTSTFTGLQYNIRHSLTCNTILEG